MSADLRVVVPEEDSGDGPSDNVEDNPTTVPGQGDGIDTVIDDASEEVPPSAAATNIGIISLLAVVGLVVF